jgi:hypothetical protein
LNVKKKIETEKNRDFAIQTLGKLGRRRERARELSEAGSGKVFLSDKGEVMM